MSDTTEINSSLSAIKQQPESHLAVAENSEMPRKDVDTLLGFLGRPGRYQIIAFFLLAFMHIPFAYNSLAMIFLGGRPSGSHCGGTEVNISRPEDLPGCRTMMMFTSDGEVTSCMKPSAAWTNTSSKPGFCNNCSLQYDFHLPSETTIVSEFDLICENYWLTSMGTTIYFVGCMFGGALIGLISDAKGRKTAILVATLLLIGSGFGVTFAPNIWVFLVFRFLVGCFMQGADLTAFTLLMETFSGRYREFAGVSAQLMWVSGVISLAGIAYGLPNWRNLQLFITIVPVIVLPCLLFVKESIRWLYVSQKFEEAKSATASILKFNNLPKSKKVSDCENYLVLWYQKEDDDSLEKDGGYSTWNLFSSPQLRKRILGLMYIWFVASLWYYVISFAITDLFGEKHVNVAIAGSLELPATLLTMVATKRFGCRRPLIWTCAITAVLSIIAGSLPTSTTTYAIIRTVFAQFARGGTHALFNAMLPYASDLMPTVVRNKGLGVCSFAMRLGGVLAPQLLLLGTYTSPEVPFVLCGILGLGGAAVTYILPETRGVRLPETVEDIMSPS
ncbi:hypothetical protein RvY_10520 [Ramazzottius varieornatus]|uniref:Major facilitator superfamily (MFS) profile domain-containing protein n=1 Tax=Ramazzottius varieornatus TaxID=947166 RepID=A0A1D1VM13_RAMVA|nr:hypothetical protein RvY_10520 [Ramazzottius varieornatus]